MQPIFLIFFVLSVVITIGVDDAFANDGRIILETASLEHLDTIGRHNSLVQVDSDTYALAHSGTGGDGYISTFTISSDGTSIVKVNSLEHDTTHGQYNSLVHVDSDIYALAYTGEGLLGYISTFRIDSDGAITLIKTQSQGNNLEHDENLGWYNSLVQVDSNTIALAYAGLANDGYISTFTISSSGVITAVKTQSGGNNLEHDGSNGTHNSLLQIDSDTYALAYSGHRADGYITTFTISSDGSSITEVSGSILEHDENKGEYNSLVHVDSDTYALAYSGHDDDGYITTFTISSSGVITAVKTQSGGNNLEHDENKGIHNSLVQVDSDTYALAYTGTETDGYISTFTISSDGTSIVKVNSLEHDTDVGNFNSLVQVDSDTYALAYTSSGKDGWITTFTIKSNDGIIRYAPHINDKVLVQLNSDKEFILNAKDTNIINISSQVGDTINITISACDDAEVELLSPVTFVTNFAKKPSDMNNYFAGNTLYGKTGLSVYKLNQNSIDQSYSYGETLTWNDSTTVKRDMLHCDNDGLQSFDPQELVVTYSMVVNKVVEQTPVMVKIMDSDYMQTKVVLPFTLEILPNLTENPTEVKVPEIEFLTEDKSEFFIKSDKSSYLHGNKVTITGQIPIQDFDPKQGQNIKFSITSPENQSIVAGEFAPQLDGSFTYETFAMDTIWKIDGEFNFNFNFGSIDSNLVMLYDNKEFKISNLERATEVKVVEPIVTPPVATPVVKESNSAPLGIALFVDTSKNPQHYIDRYFNEPKYKEWFDKNYPQYISIYQAVGLEEPIVTPPVATPVVEQKIVERTIPTCGAGTEDVNGICQVMSTEEKTSSLKIYQSRRQ